MTSAVPHYRRSYGKAKGARGGGGVTEEKPEGGRSRCVGGSERKGGNVEERGEEREKQPQGDGGGSVLCAGLKGQLDRLQAAITENYTSQTHKAPTHEGDMNGAF